VPAIYPFGFMASDGGLLSSGVDLIDLYRWAALYVDRVLNGVKPADLPVQVPTKFELVVNLKTAKALGLEAPAAAARPRRRGDRVTRTRPPGDGLVADDQYLASLPVRPDPLFFASETEPPALERAVDQGKSLGVLGKTPRGDRVKP
jgi:hypothetical protein